MDPADLEIHRRPDPSVIDAIGALLADLTVPGGPEPLSEQKHLDLAGLPGRRFTALLLPRRSGATPAGYAHLHPDPGGGTEPAYHLEVVVDPGSPGPDDAARVLLDGALAEVARAGGGTVTYWVPAATPADEDRAAASGFAPDRSLLQMRCALPLAAGGPSGTRAAGATIRAFEPGRDEDAWLRVNNRAFAGHPEQGGWTMATILERERAPWFDPQGFRLLEVDGRLAGSCWTKVHREAHPPEGEIYVIAVDPEFSGHGFGRTLAVDGLDHLARSGLTVGMLYVDGANDPAVGLYRSLGFTEARVDRSFVARVEGSGDPADQVADEEGHPGGHPGDQ